jgi:hypothetical protein
LSYKETLIENPDLEDIDNWPEPDIDYLKEAQRSLYLRNLNIVKEALEGKKKTSIAEDNRVSPSRVTKLLNRCLTPVNGVLPLSDGFIPNKIINPITRDAPLSIDGDCGARGSMIWIMANYQNIETLLEKKIRDDLSNSPNSENLTCGSAYRKFIRELKKNDWPKNRYPFDREHKGKESFRLWYKKKRREIQHELMQKENRGPTSPKPNVALAYQEIEIDEQRMDVTTAIHLMMAEHLKPIKIPRVTLILARDKAIGVILDYIVVFSREANQDDIIKLLSKLLKYRPLRDINTPGAEYAEEAAFPTAIDDRLQSIGFGTIKLDNSWAHHANKVVSYICNTMSSSVRYGRVKKPKDRREVEHAFKLASQLVRRFKSTTGSHPHDPIKDKSGKVPVLMMVQFLDVLETYISGLNAKGTAKLAGHSPLSTVIYQLDSQFMQYNFDQFKDRQPHNIEKQRAKIRFDTTDGGSSYIRFKKHKYRGKCLSEFKHHDGNIQIRYDINDIRTLTVLTSSGVEIGKCFIPLSWQNAPLSLRTLKEARKAQEKHGDVVNLGADGYLDWLAESGENNLELYRVGQEIGVDNSESPHQKETLIGLKKNNKKSLKEEAQANFNSFIAKNFL